MVFYVTTVAKGSYEAQFGKITDNIRRGIARGMAMSAEQTKAVAIRNCPISPTQSQINAARKAEGRRPVKHRKGSTRPAPGGLCRSISAKSNDDGFTIYIAPGSEGEAYANYIHNLKGKKWFKRGIGTIAKGRQADEKFITRAISAMRDKILDNIDREISRALA